MMGTSNEIRVPYIATIETSWSGAHVKRRPAFRNRAHVPRVPPHRRSLLAGEGELVVEAWDTTCAADRSVACGALSRRGHRRTGLAARCDDVVCEHALT